MLARRSIVSASRRSPTSTFSNLVWAARYPLTTSVAASLAVPAAERVLDSKFRPARVRSVASAHFGGGTGSLSGPLPTAARSTMVQFQSPKVVL
jgi:hypothetical protein